MQTTRTNLKREGGAATTIALLLLGLLLLGGVAAYCYTQLIPNIETDLGKRVSIALENEGFPDVEVAVKGTDVMLMGVTDSDDSANASRATAARQVAEGIYGVSKVSIEGKSTNNAAGDSGNSINPELNSGNSAIHSGNYELTSDSDSLETTLGDNSENAAAQMADSGNKSDTETLAVIKDQNSTANTLPTPDSENSAALIKPGLAQDSEFILARPSLNLGVAEDQVVLGGVLPDTKMALRIVASVTEKYGMENVENQISIVPETQSPVWIEGALAIIDRIDNITNPSLKISEQTALLAGEVSSETLGAQQLSAAKRALGSEMDVSATFSISPRVTELPTPESRKRETKKRPASLRIESNNDTVRLTGTVSNNEEAETVRIELSELLVDIDYTDELIIDDSVSAADWISEALAVTDSVKDIANFSVSINSGQMMLGGDITNRERGKSLADTATELVSNKLSVVNNYSINQAELVIESREEVLARELRQKLGALDTKKIIFNPGSAILTTEAMKVLDAAASLIAIYPDLTVEISGHTDASGDSVTNLELSKKRAFSVRDYLVTKGLPDNQLRPIGYGESNPVADNSTQIGRAANRRIEFNL